MFGRLNTKRVLTLALVSSIFLIGATTSEAEAQDNSPAASEVNQSTSDTVTTGGKKPKKITDRRHPDYVRCRSRPVIGSLARKRRVCMTNREWVTHIQEGNRRSGEFIEDLQGGMKVE